jgi:hypothetical protein
MDRAEVLKRAKHYRELAMRTQDDWARRALMDIAEGYELLAERFDDTADGSYGDDP